MLTYYFGKENKNLKYYFNFAYIKNKKKMFGYFYYYYKKKLFYILN